jgi:endonuclease-3 related protein
VPHLLRDVYERLYHAFGPQHWWPGQSPFEVMVGAVLVQNTAWKNVERAIDNLREADLLEPHALAAVPEAELAELIRPAGYYRLKTRRLKNLLDFLIEEYDGSLDEMFASGADALRPQLLAVNGVGPETADSILLYACQLPVFVVDAYTARVLKRHGWIEPEADYHAIQDYFAAHLEEDVVLYNEYHALLVRVGHLHCRKTPKCDECPLREMLPEGGPQEDW